MINWDLIMDLIRTIISFGGIILIILFIIKIKRKIKDKKSVRGKIVLGTHCYGCKDHIDDTPLNELLTINTQVEQDAFFKRENFRLCIACRRNGTLNEVTNHSKANIILKVKKYLYSKKSNFLPLYYLVVYFTFFGLDIWMKSIGQTRFFFYAYNIVLLVYWYVMFKRVDLDYINKSEE